MEKDEKDINDLDSLNNIDDLKSELGFESELLLEEKLENQDEFAFLDEPQDEPIQEISEIEESREVLNENNIDESVDTIVSQDENNELLSEKSLDNEMFDENIENDFTRDVEEVSLSQTSGSIVELGDEDDFEQTSNKTDELITVRPVKFQQFELTPPNRTIKKNLDIMQDISLHVSVELGRTKSTIREVMEMEKGTIVELDKIAGEQVEVFVNDKLVAKGEVIVIEDKFGVRVTSTNIQKVIQ